MSTNHDSLGRPSSLQLGDLVLGYLHDQTDAQARGLGLPDFGDEAVPHDLTPVQPVDPELAWADAVAVVPHLTGVQARWAVPADWPALVNGREPALALAFCLGNFPQLVRNLQPLLSGDALAVRLVPAGAVPAPALLESAAEAREATDALLAAGALRLAGHYKRAEELLGQAPAGWETVHANEVAALAWHRGEHPKALALWNEQPDSVPVLFNRGMAALFLGQREAARDNLDRAIRALPETSAWHHLACLYRALARTA